MKIKPIAKITAAVLFSFAATSCMDFVSEEIKSSLGLKDVTLTLDLNGGTGEESITGKHKSTIVSPTPEKEGYAFVGWEPKMPETFLLDDTTAYTAKWAKIFIFTKDNISEVAAEINELPDTEEVYLKGQGTFESWSNADKKGNLYSIKESFSLSNSTRKIHLDLSETEGFTRISYNDLLHDFNALASVLLPSSVTSIDNCAFQNCSRLTTVTIPDSVTSIGNCAFLSCFSLTSVTIPDSVISIGNCAFQNCSSLTNVTIPGSVTSVNSKAFFDCTSLTSAIFKNTNGWKVYSSSNSTGTTINVTNPPQNAEYLKDTYKDYTWNRTNF